jgi:hypothetical protein
MSKRLKYKSVNYIPNAYAFSEVYELNQVDDPEFDISDLGKEVDDLYDKLTLEELVLEILHNLNDREKVIFMFQLLRGDGYNLDHHSCAKTLHIERQWYMVNLSRVRKKVGLILQANKDKASK